jgi:dTDP-4-dehydrorhamnose reductase
MKFLIIGASGFIGHNVLQHVRSLGFKAIGTQSQQRTPDLVKFDLLRDRIVDCVGKSFFQSEDRVCVVICSVVSDMDRCLKERDLSYRINVTQTIELIKEVQAYQAKVIFLSSCFVFDGSIGYYDEDYPVTPINEYARHKVAVEQFLQNHVPDAFVARLEKIVGDDPNQRQLFANWYRLLQADEPITCIEGSLLSPTFVKDVAQAFLLSCQMNLAGIYHVSNSEFFYRDELARQFCYAAGRAPKVVSRPLAEFNFPDKRALKCYLDGSKFAQATGLRFTPMRQVFRAFFKKSQELSSVSP